MKFFCDRCKTRYSIADERVRGKILKIRCKNCANVITVREGMSQDGPVAAADPRPRRTSAAPGASLTGSPAASRPLEAAFASAMSAPAIKVPPAAPDALEEEWYVSIDGEQSGPFSLHEAQAWVGARRPSDELYCWNEGFDDWLPVEKVSHFRGLRSTGPRRSQPVTGAPPPVPLRAVRPEDTPQPLFAATLAALEDNTRIDANPFPVPDVPSNGRATPTPLRGTSGGVAGSAAPARTSALPKPSLPKPGTGPAPAIPTVRPVGPSAPTLNMVASSASAPTPSVKPGTGPSAALATAAATAAAPAIAKPAPVPVMPKPSNGHGASALFDSGDDVDAGTSDPFARIDAAAKATAAATAADTAVEGDDELAIGEVSRVVRIADLAKPQSRPTAASSSAGMASRRSGPIAARGTNSVPRIDQAAIAAGGSGDALIAMPAPGEIPPDAAAPAPVISHKSHALFLAIGVLVLGAIAAVVIVVATQPDDEAPPISGPDISEDVGELSYSVDPVTGKVEIKKVDPATSPNNGTGGRNPGTRPKNPNNNGGNTNTNNGGKSEVRMGRNGLPLTDLDGSEVDATAQKYSTGFMRCYEQAKKKDPFLEVKKIYATLTVDRSGQVTSVSLSSFSNHHLGMCLAGAIKRWPFRESTDGITSQISIVFQNS
jgi:predicted Zn finger-like uncharacterized protein